MFIREAQPCHVLYMQEMEPQTQYVSFMHRPEVCIMSDFYQYESVLLSQKRPVQLPIVVVELTRVFF